MTVRYIHRLPLTVHNLRPIQSPLRLTASTIDVETSRGGLPVHADSHGVLEFQFDLAWTPSGDGSANHGIIAETLQSEPTVVINVPQREHPLFMQRLYR